MLWVLVRHQKLVLASNERPEIQFSEAWYIHMLTHSTRISLCSVSPTWPLWFLNHDPSHVQKVAGRNKQAGKIILRVYGL